MSITHSLFRSSLRRFLFYSILSLSVAGLWSCQKEAALHIDSQAEILTGEDGSSAAVTFTANRDWEISASENWVHFDKMSGPASDSPISVAVTCDPNTTYDDRTCVVTILSGGLKQTVTITQPAKSGLMLEGQSDYSLAPDAQSLEVEVRANVAYDVHISADWIKQAGTKALSSSTLVFSVEENTTAQARSASISISGAGLTQVITVNQDPAQNPASSKILKSVTANGDYPHLYFSSFSMEFTYDEDDRLVEGSWKTSGPDSYSTQEATVSYEYSGDSFAVSVSGRHYGEATLDDSGRISSISAGPNRIDLEYDSDGRLLSLNTGGNDFIRYRWESNDLYSFYAPGYEDEVGLFHFEPSSFYSPVNGVDINVIMRVFAGQNEMDRLLYTEENWCLVMMPDMTGKRSEHALSIVLEGRERGDGSYSVYDFAENGGEYKVDGSWHPLRDLLRGDFDIIGTVAIRCSGVPYKRQSLPWEWSSEDGFLPSGARWPLLVSTASLSGTLRGKSADWDRNGDGRIDESDGVQYEVQDVTVTEEGSVEYSINYSFEYE